MKIFNKIINKLGYQITSLEVKIPIDIQQDKPFMEIYEKCKPYTMTSPERMYSLHKSVQNVVKNNINGDFVECGVWKGGSSMVIALTLLQMNDSFRRLYLYDTFEGMSEPSALDKDISGADAEIVLNNSDREDSNSIWCYSGLEEVKKNLLSTGLPSSNIKFIKGMVEETIPGTISEKIALLRLDTDWYESTLHELNHLYPLVSKNGVVIIDDYGHWQGARKAVDEFLEKQEIKPLLHRIDYTGRIIQKLN